MLLLLIIDLVQGTPCVGKLIKIRGAADDNNDKIKTTQERKKYMSSNTVQQNVTEKKYQNT